MVAWRGRLLILAGVVGMSLLLCLQVLFFAATIKELRKGVFITTRF